MIEATLARYLLGTVIKSKTSNDLAIITAISEKLSTPLLITIYDISLNTPKSITFMDIPEFTVVTQLDMSDLAAAINELKISLPEYFI